MSQHEATVTLGPLEDMRVRFEYTPGRPGCMYLRNGDPGYPDEPPELYITEVQVRGKWLDSCVFQASGWLEAAEQKLMEDSHKLDEAADERAWDDQQERLAERGYP